MEHDQASCYSSTGSVFIQSETHEILGEEPEEEIKPTTTAPKRKRLRRKDLSPEQWIAHKKLRKKIASAKWYANKQAVIVAKRERRLAKRKDMLDRRNPLSDKYQPNEYERLDVQCRMEHNLNGWPMRNPAIEPAQWLQILELAKECVDRMKLDPVYEASKLRLCKHLCVEELKNEFLRWNESIEHVRNRCITPATAPDSSSSSVSERAWHALTGGWFPWACTWLGFIFVGLKLRGEEHRWPDLKSYIYLLTQTKRNTLPIQEGTHPAMHAPVQIPAKKDHTTEGESNSLGPIQNAC